VQDIIQMDIIHTRIMEEKLNIFLESDHTFFKPTCNVYVLTTAFTTNAQNQFLVVTQKISSTSGQLFKDHLGSCCLI
jgi:hypothetical protein